MMQEEHVMMTDNRFSAKPGMWELKLGGDQRPRKKS
jgi:hypothetical protein